MKLTKLKDYIAYVDAPEGPAPSLWIDKETLHPSPGHAETTKYPLYFAWNVFALHPELLEDVELSPKFVEDLLPFCRRHSEGLWMERRDISLPGS